MPPTLTASLPPIRRQRYVASIDADGCYFNDFRFNNNNNFLFEHLESVLAGVAYGEIIPGTNRQSYKTDYSNSSRCTPPSPLFVHEIQRIQQRLQEKFPKLILNKFLLPDLYANLPHGESFDRAACPHAHRRHDHEDFIFDESKISLLYAQMHKLGSEHPDEDISFDFFDDREDILQWLKNFFDNNKMFVPGNVHLRLYQYDGSKKPGLIAEIQSDLENPDRFIDSSYEGTVHTMWSAQKENVPEHYYKGMHNLHEKFSDPSHLSNVRTQRVERFYAKALQQLENFTAWPIPNLQNKISELLAKIKSANKNNNLPLYGKLLNAIFACVSQVTPASLEQLKNINQSLLDAEVSSELAKFINGLDAHYQNFICVKQEFNPAESMEDKIKQIAQDLKVEIENNRKLSFIVSASILEYANKLLRLAQSPMINFQCEFKQIKQNALSNPDSEKASALLERLEYEVVKAKVASVIVGQKPCLLKNAAQQILDLSTAIASSSTEKPAQLSPLTNVLVNVAKCVEQPQKFEHFQNLAAFTQTSDFKQIPQKCTSRTEIFFAALLCVLGVVVITASIMAAIESFGISTPLSLWGLKMGTGLILSGVALTAVAGASVALGAGAVAGGSYLCWHGAKSPLAHSTRKLGKLAPPVQKSSLAVATAA